MTDNTTTPETGPEPGDNPAGLVFPINRDWLRLMNGVRGGHARRGDSGRDMMHNFGAGAWNNNLGNRMRRLEDAGLAVRDQEGTWSLTVLGERRRAQTENDYNQARIGSPPPA